jgi:hypothetical protein
MPRWLTQSEIPSKYFMTLGNTNTFSFNTALKELILSRKKRLYANYIC